MKVLQAVHYFLPRHQAGTEIYTAQLSRALRSRGAQVVVLASEDGAPAGRRFELVEDQWDGLRVVRLMRGEPPDFERSYLDPEIDALFARLLAELRPDVVHFQHTFRLSIGMIAECARAGIPAFLTLADFFYLCPPILLLRPRGELCPGPDPDACARCGNSIGALYSGTRAAAWSQSRRKLIRMSGEIVQGGADRLVRGAHAAKRHLPGSLLHAVRRLREARELADPDSAFARRRALIAARHDAMREALAAARLIISPSAFLRDKMIAAGLALPERIIHSDYGFDPAPFAARHQGAGVRGAGAPTRAASRAASRATSNHLRFGFIGTPVEHKGVHVAIEAMNLLTDTSAELIIHGDLTWFPAYARRLRRLARNPRIRFAGPFDHARIAEIFANLDALIVPSLWYENSPLTIHEAFLAQTPVIASNLGGMAELLSPGGGLTFIPADPASLASTLRPLIANPASLAELARAIPPVKTIAENAEEVMGLYQRG
jgi:glycosyltransferase involved in cell wall biosynthesis